MASRRKRQFDELKSLIEDQQKQFEEKLEKQEKQFQDQMEKKAKRFEEQFVKQQNEINELGTDIRSFRREALGMSVWCCRCLWHADAAAYKEWAEGVAQGT